MLITEATLRFLQENRLRNSREWYQEHKLDYRRLVTEPMAELAERLLPTMLELDPLFATEPNQGRHLSRINRDTRFSHDKSLYREVMWVVFTRDKKAWECPPGFVFEFSPDGFRYGCGYYSVPPKYMEAVRALILAGDPSYLAAKKAMDAQSTFHLEGEMYKRSRYPDRPEDERDWLDRKCLCWLCNSTDFPLLYSEDLYRPLAEGFRLLKPVYDFLWKAEERMRRAE